MASAARASVDTIHGRYRIIAGWVGDQPRACAWLDRVGILTSAGADLSEAVANAQAALCSRDARELRVRRRQDVPTALEFEEALRIVRMNDDDRAMLRAHARASDGVIDASELGDVIGLACDVWAAAQYGALGQKIARALNLEPSGLNGDPTAWIAILADPVDATSSAWRMHPELRSALAGHGLDA